MKRIAKALVIVTLATTAAVATAADFSYPSAGIDGYNQTSVFPNIDTYANEHRDGIAAQPFTGYPSAAQQEYPLSSEFPDMQTYQDIHRNDPVYQSTAPTFPYSVPGEPSMADEGLVPGIAGVSPYVSPLHDYAVGATR
jgi:hypothetical protein